ncbi:MAG TPA: hypothetical protein VLJ17_24580 [Xanthobacteraceae bacterium]|nr:hypothetical protein [Xanthobacteraceae bacterium]
MNKVAIAFLTKDRPELTQQTIVPLFQPDRFDLFWIDGSVTPNGRNAPLLEKIDRGAVFELHQNIRGGADAAVAYAYTKMLNHHKYYDYMGIVENDVLLPGDWFDRTMALFRMGDVNGFQVGAVSARAYEDRILFQRDSGYAAMHNLGYGMQILSRPAAELHLKYFRTGNTRENRKVFMQLAEVDVGRWFPWRNLDQAIVSDWHQDLVLASEGYASLALTPSDVEMIGQVPPLKEQGLTIVKEPVNVLRDDVKFENYIARLNAIYNGEYVIDTAPRIPLLNHDGMFSTIFAHHVGALGGRYVSSNHGIGDVADNWQLKWSQGYGPFAYEAKQKGATIELPINGPCDLVVSGGKKGGRIEVTDPYTKYRAFPDLPPEQPHQPFITIPVPAQVAYRTLKLVAHDPGVTFYAVCVKDEQNWDKSSSFDWDKLPAVEPLKE